MLPECSGSNLKSLWVVWMPPVKPDGLWGKFFSSCHSGFFGVGGELFLMPLLKQNTLTQRNKTMPQQIKNIQFKVDEILEVKLKSLSGKNQLNTNDYQRIIQSLIERSFEGSNGKKII